MSRTRRDLIGLFRVVALAVQPFLRQVTGCGWGRWLHWTAEQGLAAAAGLATSLNQP